MSQCRVCRSKAFSSCAIPFLLIQENLESHVGTVLSRCCSVHSQGKKLLQSFCFAETDQSRSALYQHNVVAMIVVKMATRQSSLRRRGISVIKLLPGCSFFIDSCVWHKISCQNPMIKCPSLCFLSLILMYKIAAAQARAVCRQVPLSYPHIWEGWLSRGLDVTGSSLSFALANLVGPGHGPQWHHSPSSEPSLVQQLCKGDIPGSRRGEHTK